MLLKTYLNKKKQHFQGKLYQICCFYHKYISKSKKFTTRNKYTIKWVQTAIYSLILTFMMLALSFLAVSIIEINNIVKST